MDISNIEDAQSNFINLANTEYWALSNNTNLFEVTKSRNG